MIMDKPFSQACENNKRPILEKLIPALAGSRQLLEIGSGTGQHAVFFAPRLPHLHWHTSDLLQNHAGINRWIDAFPAANLHRPLALDVNQCPWSVSVVDAVFTANTCHIMPWSAVEAMFAGLKKILAPRAVVVIYGPFKYRGRFTTESNARFDQWLKAGASHQGIRDIEAVTELACAVGLDLVADHSMPANNQLLVFNRALSE